MANMFDEAITPSEIVAQFAKVGIEISERELRRKVREIGAYRKIGKAMFLFPDDVAKLMEASRPAKAPSRPVRSRGYYSKGVQHSSLEEAMERLQQAKKKRSKS